MRSHPHPLISLLSHVHYLPFYSLFGRHLRLFFVARAGLDVVGIVLMKGRRSSFHSSAKNNDRQVVKVGSTARYFGWMTMWKRTRRKRLAWSALDSNSSLISSRLEFVHCGRHRQLKWLHLLRGYQQDRTGKRLQRAPFLQVRKAVHRKRVAIRVNLLYSEPVGAKAAHYLKSILVKAIKPGCKAYYLCYNYG